MEQRVSALDWTATPLGAIDRWPHALRTATDLCLHLRFPAMIWWGPQLINIYNDAFAALLGSRHPDALGGPGPAVWPAGWERFQPQVEAVMQRGESVLEERVPLWPGADGEPVYVSASCSPIADDAGRVGGMLCICTDETAHVQTEAAVTETRRKLDAALLAGEVGTFEWDILRDRLWGDRNFARMFSITLDPTGAAPLAQYLAAIHPDDRARVAALVRRTVDTGCDYETEYRIVSGGQLRWVIARGKAERDAGGSIVRFPGVVLDVTGRRRAEDALLVAYAGAELERRRLAAVLDALPAGVAIADVDGRISLFNDALVRIWGMPPAAASVADYGAWRGRWADSGEPLAAHDWAMARVLRTGEAVPGDVVEIEKFGSGERATIINAAAPIRDAHGRLVGGVVAEVDITAQKRAEDELRRSTLLLQAISDSTGDVIFAKDRAGRLTYVNPATLALIGKPAEQVLGRTDLEVLADQDAARAVMANDRRIMAQGEPEELEEIVPLPDGTPRIWLSRKLPYRDAAGHVVGLLGVSRDITGRKQAEEERNFLLDSERIARLDAERANRLKDEFLATLSHELRTPLNAILGWAQLMGTGKADMEKGAEIIERNARVQARLIEDLLDMSRIESGKFELQARPLRLAEVVRNAVDSVRHVAQKKDVTIEESDAAGACLLEGDAARLQQAVWNLLDNAIKFSAPCGTVAVSLGERRGMAEIVVSDAGEGIDPDFLPYLFDRFRQADASTTRRHGGLGLGLAIVKHIAERHGGSVRADSAGKGAGARFTLRLPLLDWDSPAFCTESMQPNAARNAFRLDGYAIVALDDDSETIALVRHVLEQRGAAVRTCNAAEDALAAIRAQPPDLVISDIGMPGMDGYAFVRALRALPGIGKDIPVIALTAFARGEDRRQALDAGFTAHLTKPVAPQTLLQAVEYGLRQSAAAAGQRADAPGPVALPGAAR